MPKICYVVVNYFSHAKVAELVSTIGRQDDVFGIIVDNSNNDEEFQALSAAIKRQDVCCIQAERNGGFSYGTNLGIQAGWNRADFFLILNPDTTVSADFFSVLLEIGHAFPDAAVSPHGIHMETGKIWSAGGRFYWHRGRADVVTVPRRSGETEFGTCACLMVPKQAIEDIGALDEDFFLGGEEWDFSLRLRRAGWPILYSDRARYEHEVSGTHEKYGLRFFYVGMRTKVLFARKHYGAWFWPWLICLMLPSTPMLLWRNAKLNHGRVKDMIPRLLLATMRSVRGLKMTEQEYRTEGNSL